MSGNVTKIGLDVAADGSRTDWSRLRALSDAEIEAAVAADADSYLLERGAVGRARGSYRYLMAKTSQGEWRWSLVDAKGEIIAVGGQSYPTRRAIEAAVSVIRDAMLGARSEAA